MRVLLLFVDDDWERVDVISTIGAGGSDGDGDFNPELLSCDSGFIVHSVDEAWELDSLMVLVPDLDVQG